MIIYILIKAFIVRHKLASLAMLCFMRILLGITNQWLLDYIIKMRLSSQSKKTAKGDA